MTRPDWNNYFLGLAFLISSRSRDAETQHGCVIVDDNNIIIGTGYNSHIKGINDALLPNTRPEKYRTMFHAEVNSLLNCSKPPRDCKFATAYITGNPCTQCLQSLLQAGIKKLVIAKRQGTKLESAETEKDFNFFIEQTKVIVEYIDVNLDWAIDHLTKINYSAKS